MYDINGFGLRVKSIGGFAVPGKPLASAIIGGAIPTNWGSLATCQSFTAADSLGLGMDCDGVPNNNVRYDTPVFGGFSASASWGEDDVWALSGRYAGEHAGFKLAAAIGYVDSTNDNGAGVKEAAERARGGKKASALQIGAYVQHVPTGLFVYGAYGKDYNDTTGALGPFGQQKDADSWYLKAGLRQKWSPLGHSVVYGEYGENNGQDV